MTEYMAENKSDDLDLIALAERVLSFCRKFGRFIAISAIVGLLAGLILYVILPNRYSSTLLLHSFTLTNTEHLNIVDNWNELLKEKNYAALSNDLNCDSPTLVKVKKISAAEMQKVFVQNNPNGFIVEIVVSDTSVLDTLQKGIVHGLENGGYLKEKLETKRSNLRQLIQQAKNEISKLDSTKSRIEKSINNDTAKKSSSSYIIDISNITGQMVNLHEKLLSYQEELKFTNAVQVLHNFGKFGKPSSPKFLKLIVLGFLAGFIIGYFASLYKSLRSRMAQRVQLQKS